MEPVYKWEVTIGVQPSVQPGDRAVELAAATKLQALHRGNSARKQVQHEVEPRHPRPRAFHATAGPKRLRWAT